MGFLPLTPGLQSLSVSSFGAGSFTLVSTSAAQLSLRTPQIRKWGGAQSGCPALWFMAGKGKGVPLISLSVRPASLHLFGMYDDTPTPNRVLRPTLLAPVEGPFTFVLGTYWRCFKCPEGGGCPVKEGVTEAQPGLGLDQAGLWLGRPKWDLLCRGPDLGPLETGKWLSRRPTPASNTLCTQERGMAPPG